MRTAVVAEIIRDFRRALGNLAANGAFAVQNAHGVALQAGIAGLAELILIAFKIRSQRLSVLRTAGGAADGVDGDLNVIGKAETIENGHSHSDDLCVRRRFCGAEHLHAELVQLTQTARLRLFVAVAGGLIVELYRVTAVIQAVFQHGAHSARRALRAQRNGAAALIFKRVHLLFHHVGGVADGAQEELGVLKHRGANLGKAVQFRFIRHNGFHKRPFFGFTRNDIHGALRRFCDQFHKISLSFMKNKKTLTQNG